MALGIPSFALGSGSSWPTVWPTGVMRDNYDVSWDRQQKVGEAFREYALLPSGTSTYTGSSYDLSLSSSDFEDADITLIIPDLTAVQLGVGASMVYTVQTSSNGSSWSEYFSVTQVGSLAGAAGTTVNKSGEIDTPSRYVRQVITAAGNVSGAASGAATNFIVYGDITQRRKVERVTGHLVVNALSTVNDAFDSFVDLTSVTNPIFYVGNNSESGGVRPVVYNGEWQVDKITVDDGQNRSSTITVTLIQENAWQLGSL